MKNRLYGLLFIALAGAELSYLYLLGSLLDGPLYTLILMLLLYPLALGLGCANLRPGLRLAVELSLTGAVILFVSGQQLYTGLAAGQTAAGGIILRALFCGLAWWLGHSVPQQDIRFTTIAFRLQVGFIALVILAQVTGSVATVFIFFLLSPLALFLARRADAYARGAAALGGVRPAHAVLALGSVAVPGVLLLFLLSPGLAGAILFGLGNIFARLSAWSVAQQQGHDGTFVPYSWSCSLRPDSQSSTGGGPEPGFSPSGDGTTPEAVIWVVVGLCLVALLALIALAVRNTRARQTAAADQPVPFEVKTLVRDTARELRRLIADFCRRLGRWFLALFRRKAGAEELTDDAPQSIRALYRGFLRWADKQGLARQAAQTPAEHGRLVAQRFPERQGDTEQITGDYAVARYSRNPPATEVFDRARAAWQRLQASSR